MGKNLVSIIYIYLRLKIIKKYSLASYSENPPLAKKFEKDDYCLALCADGFYRAQVINNLPDGNSEFMLIDLGSIETENSQQLLELPDYEEFRTRKAGFFFVHAEGLDQLDENQKSKLESWIQVWHENLHARRAILHILE